MLRLGFLMICVSFLGCRSLTNPNPASSQFMSLASKAQSLAATAGIAAVESDQSCSGALIGNPEKAEGPAYLLTAGHCLIDFDDSASSNRIFRDALPRSDRNLIHFPKADFHIGRVLYATMKGIDIAIAEITEQDIPGGIFRLTERSELDAEDNLPPPPAVTLQRLRELGITPLRLATALPGSGDSIRIISAPLPDDTESKAPFLREHRCRHEGVTDVVEGIWHWYGLARNNCDNIFPGNSGAPVINAAAEVFAVVNTSSRNALSQDCYTGQPCELTSDAFQVAQDRNYGSLVINLSRCFNAKGQFQVEQSGCELDLDSHFRITRQSPTPVNPERQKADQRVWNVESTMPAGWHFKTGPLPRIDCRNIDQYSGALAADDRRVQTLPLPRASGVHALCLITDRQYSDRDLRHPAMIVINIDDHPPLLKPRLVLNPANGEPLMAVRKSCQNLPGKAVLELRKGCAVAVISFETQPYEVVDFYHGWIGPKDQDCSHVQGENRGPQAHIPVSALPVNLCIWSIDGAGNRALQPVIQAIRAATRREIIEATDVMVDWSALDPVRAAEELFPPAIFLDIML